MKHLQSNVHIPTNKGNLNQALKDPTKSDLERLEYALLLYVEEGSKDELVLWVREAFESRGSHSIEYYHDLYWRLLEKGGCMDHFDCYEELKISIFTDFLSLWDEEQTFLEYFSAPDYEIIKISVDALIYALLATQPGIFDSLQEAFTDYGVVDDDSIRTFVTKIHSACVIDRRLSKEQKNLLDRYGQEVSQKTPKITRKTDGKYHIVRNENVYFPSELRHDLEFRLYLLGERDVRVTSYRLQLGGSIARARFNSFVLWFWDWAQKEKPSDKLVPDRLKRFCAQVMSFVAQNNDGTRYKAHDFRTRDLDLAWTTFRVAANDANKWSKKNPP